MREWSLFPQMKEGALCGTGKLAALARRYLDNLQLGNGTAHRGRIADDVARGFTRDLWRPAILWEYGGIAADVVALEAILASGGADALGRLLRLWDGEASDALLYFGRDGARTPGLPFTDVMATAPRHPLLYYVLKIVTRIATWDSEVRRGVPGLPAGALGVLYALVALTPRRRSLAAQVAVYRNGRTTKVAPVEEGLNRVHWFWRRRSLGDVLTLPDHRNASVHLVGAEDLLPASSDLPALLDPWRSLRRALRAAEATPPTPPMPSDEDVALVLRNLAAEQTAFPRGLFSCMERTLDLYLPRT